VWDLAATGPRRREQRRAIARAMGPVWEANHVWLIFVLVVLFTCFPYGYGALATALFVPFHLALVGIMLRGAAFVFRGHEASEHGAAGRWGTVFGVASVISPFLLGATFGAITSGEVRVDAARHVSVVRPMPWLSGYAIGCGTLALSTCAYLAAVYLGAETDGDLREDFRRRAIIAGTTTAALAAAVLLLAYNEAGWFLTQLLAPRSWPVLTAGLWLFAMSAWAVFRRRYRLARVFVAGEIVVLLTGWGLAHRPYLIYPDMTLEQAAGPIPTIRVLMFCLPVGLAMLVPSLWLLFRVFKSRTPTTA
jgi:cytochrome d ubiquinol oxidase subunit II